MVPRKGRKAAPIKRSRGNERKRRKKSVAHSADGENSTVGSTVGPSTKRKAKRKHNSIANESTTVSKTALKRARRTRADAQPESKSTNVVVIVAGSAGGRPPKDVRQALEGVASRVVYVPEGDNARWKGWNPAGKNQRSLYDAIIKEAASSQAEQGRIKIVVAGSSFGCRVAARLFADVEPDLPDAVSRSLMCFGFPLYRPKPGQDRTGVFAQLPEGLRVLMVSGETDPFLNRPYQELPRGGAGLQALTRTSPATVTVVTTSKGKHNPLDGATPEEKTQLIQTMSNFVNSTCR